MSDYQLVAATRTEQGKQVKKLRTAGKVPAVLYGHNIENQLVTLDDLAFKRTFHQAGHAALVKLEIESKPAVQVLIADVQTDHLGGILHADLHQVNMDEIVNADIPIRLIGDAPGVFNLGGTLVQPLEMLEVEALPANLPQSIEVDISGLVEFDASISVSDIKLSDKVTIITDTHELICRIDAPRSDEEMAALEADMGDEVPAELAEEKAAAEAAAEEDKAANKPPSAS